MPVPDRPIATDDNVRAAHASNAIGERLTTVPSGVSTHPGGLADAQLFAVERLGAGRRRCPARPVSRPCAHRTRPVKPAGGLSVAQLAIAWTLANPAVHVAIVGGRTAEQVAATAPAAEVHLTAEVLVRIDGIVHREEHAGSPKLE